MSAIINHMNVTCFDVVRIFVLLFVKSSTVLPRKFDARSPRLRRKAKAFRVLYTTDVIHVASSNNIQQVGIMSIIRFCFDHIKCK